MWSSVVIDASTPENRFPSPVARLRKTRTVTKNHAMAPSAMCTA